MAKWVEFTGSDEQIAEMINAANGWVLKYSIAGQTDVMYGNPIRQIEFSEHTIQPPFTHYLICEPHPCADMICQWARTGQPVYWRAIECKEFTGKCLDDEFNLYPFQYPNKYEYSFTPFEEE